MIHLDTSFLIRALVRGSPEDTRLRAWLRDGEDVAMCSIAWCELLCGPITEPQIEIVTHIVRERVAFSEADALQAAALFNQSGRRRGTLTDCMIAAAALRCSATLATANPKDFSRFKPAGLVLAEP